MEILPQQAPNQESNVNTVAHQDDSAIAPLFIQGQNRSEELVIEEDQGVPMVIENSGAEDGNNVNGSLNQETGNMIQRHGTAEQDHQSGSSEKDLQLVVNGPDQNPLHYGDRWFYLSHSSQC
jgi:hypothetical protein